MTTINLTEAFLASLIPRVDPLVAGATWDLRFRALDGAGAPIDLTGAKIAWVWKTLETDGSRHHGVSIKFADGTVETVEPQFEGIIEIHRPLVLAADFPA